MGKNEGTIKSDNLYAVLKITRSKIVNSETLCYYPKIKCGNRKILSNNYLLILPKVSVNTGHPEH